MSSTFLDNRERRQTVHDAILTAGLVPVGMERFAASTLPTVQECGAQVRGCDWLIGILAYRYGWIPKGEDRSITEIEYDTAKEAGMPRLMFVIDSSLKVDPHADFDQGPDRWEKQKKLDAFKAKVGADQMPAVFKEETLGIRVLAAIQAELAR
ncbi:MAG: DUF4062 domain-containing protein [Myxococcota bacterium]